MVDSHSWPPYVIDRLFLDAEDYNGLEFWFNHIKKETEKLETPAPK